MTNKHARQIEAIFRAKQNRRQELAKLPFDKKIKILVELQKTAYNLSNLKNRNKRRIWDILE
jgi:hypothetical protein